MSSVLGHSVGEIAALYAAGSLTFDDAIRFAVRSFALTTALRKLYIHISPEISRRRDAQLRRGYSCCDGSGDADH
jgi:acyl transferase domain-containing protein